MLVFEVSREGRRSFHLPKSDIESHSLSLKREDALRLPELSEREVVQHYTNLTKKIFSVDSGFYPLGSCTMKYNPKLNEDVAGLPGFSHIHPLQPTESVVGALKAFDLLSEKLAEVTGMDAITLQPAAGAQGEFASLLMIKAYLNDHGGGHKTEVIVPDSAHGTNPASAVMAGFKVVTVPSDERGLVDVEKLRELVSDKTAAIMLTNPNTLGLYEVDILEISKIIHDAGALMYCDGANMNAIMGISRPGDVGFDVIHLNLHKTFSTPHGGGGPGCGAVGVKSILEPYLPTPVVKNYEILNDRPKSIGPMKNFYGHFGVFIRALTYILSLGGNGLKESSQNAVLNANYLQHLMKDHYPAAKDQPFMHEFVTSMTKLKKETGVSALDISKGLIENGIHPPTMYFPIIVPEALMIEPTETESIDTLKKVAEVFNQLYQQAHDDAESLKEAPNNTVVKRVDEVKAARHPILVHND